MHQKNISQIPAAVFACLAILQFFLSSCASIPIGNGRSKVDFSDYDTPLNDQVVSQIKEEVAERLGPDRNTKDRFFIIPFAYENKGNDPAFSHSFMSVIRVLADDKQPKLTPDLETRTYKGRNFEAFTISWLPEDFLENPNLCVFDGVGAMLIPSRNKCPLHPGKSFDLPTTLGLAVDAKVAVGFWGPYEISKEGFDVAVGRLRLLESGELKYRADDRGLREEKVAINCFHAMSGLEELFPKGGFLGTGFKMWGLNGTRQVLREYTEQASLKGFLLEPVDIKNDLIGFVYAPSRDGGRIYNPFKGSSIHAYRK